MKLVVATWIAAVIGALAGRALAEVSSPTAPQPRAAVVTAPPAPR